MADMVELVIKIPKDAYKLLKNEGVDWLGAEHILNAVANGIPLPKGHGRLIDVDELKKIIQENDVLYITGFNVRLCDINNTPTIIEADSEREE